MNVVSEVIAGKGVFNWSEIVSKVGENELKIYVFQDALKINGVREMATAVELQQIADLLGCMLMTPKVVDLIWEQASLRFDSITRADGDIVAISTPARVSALIDQEIAKHGGDQGQLIDSVGKYWVIVNELMHPEKLKNGKLNCCNYGWPTSIAPGDPTSPPHVSEVTPTTNGKPHRVWQNLGFQHNYFHKDPSQTIRLMYAFGMLKKAGAENFEKVPLTQVMLDPELCHLISHQDVLLCHRQLGVDAPEGDIVLPNYPPPI